MGIDNLSKDVVIATLPEQPQHGSELEAVSNMFAETVDRDVVIDFSKVEMLTSESICSLMILDKLLSGAGHQLVLCNLSSTIKQIFIRTGLVTVFQFADDEETAMEYLHSRHLSWADSTP